MNFHNVRLCPRRAPCWAFGHRQRTWAPEAPGKESQRRGTGWWRRPVGRDGRPETSPLRRARDLGEYRAPRRENSGKARMVSRPAQGGPVQRDRGSLGTADVRIRPQGRRGARPFSGSLVPPLRIHRDPAGRTEGPAQLRSWWPLGVTFIKGRILGQRSTAGPPNALLRNLPQPFHRSLPGRECHGL